MFVETNRSIKNLLPINLTNYICQKNKMFNCIHWNANSIMNKKDEFENFLEINDILITSLNETKISPSDNLTFKNYVSIQKNRNSRGGGVAILIHKKLAYQINHGFDNFNLVLIAIDVMCSKNNRIVINLLFDL